MNKYLAEASNAPKAIGPYSLAAENNGLVFLSGQIPLNPETGELMAGDITVQTEQVLKNLSAVLAGCGLSFKNVLKSTIFLADLAHFKTVNELYEKALGGVKPARSTIQVAGLPRGALVEIEMIAAR